MMQTNRRWSLLWVALAVAAPVPSDAARSGGTPRLETRPAIAMSDRGLAPPPADLQRLLERRAEPRSLAAADFDEDGVVDLAAGYADAGSGLGLVAVWRGNVDALDPWGPEARRRRDAGAFTAAPFLGPPAIAALPAPADHLAAGDFDGDGHQDLAAARAGGAAIHLLAGRADGDFAAAETIPLVGRITAWAAGDVNRRDGLEDLLVAVDGGADPLLLVFEGPNGALRRAPEVLPLPTPAADLAIGRLDGDFLADIAVAAGAELVVVQGRDRRLSVSAATRAAVPPPRQLRQSLPFLLRGLAAGDFLPDRQIAQQLATLSDQGDVHLLSRWPDGGAGEPWRIGDRLATGLAAAATVGEPWPLLVPLRISGSGRSDLALVDAASGSLRVISAGRLAEGLVSATRTPSEPPLASLERAVRARAALPLRLDPDAMSELVLLFEGELEPWVAAGVGGTIRTVNSEDDSDDGFCDPAPLGDCTLREAINAASLGDSIHFDIDVGILLPPVIQPTSALPAIGSGITVDGTTQAQNAVVVSGASAGGGVDGLLVAGSSSVLRGLRIGGFSGDGIVLEGDSNTVDRCWVGLGSLGTPSSNGDSGIKVVGDFNTVGCTAVTPCNVISANGQDGIWVQGASAESRAISNVVQGNYIGTNIGGSSTYGNVDAGITVDLASTTLIGGTTAGSGNVISGNGVGIDLFDVEVTTIQRNLIGTDAAGSADLGNATHGVEQIGSSLATMIGASVTSARNVISGNDGSGIEMLSGNSATAVIQGNFIGTNANGDSPLGNGARGVSLLGVVATDDVIGGDVPGAGNTISDNDDGIRVFNPGTYVPNGRVMILGNLVGTDQAASGDLGNHRSGVLIEGVGASDVEVGDGSTAGANTVAFNQCGVLVQAGSQRTVRHNAIFSNDLLGIGLSDSGSEDCSDEGVTLNDRLDADSGANGLKNFPVIDSVTTLGGTSTISGSFAGDGIASTTIDLYSNATCGPSGFGEGEQHVGSTVVVGNGGFSIDIAAIAPGHYVTATGTSLEGTSEFSACRRDHPNCAAPPTLDLQSVTVDGQQTFEACQTITLGGTESRPSSVPDGDDALTLRAGQSVAVGNNFQVVLGELTIENDPTLAAP
jgi:CSLREA domain-containing protein